MTLLSCGTVLLYKVILTVESVGEILKYDHSNKNVWAIPICILSLLHFPFHTSFRVLRIKIFFTYLVSSPLLVQATLVPVSYECPRGHLMENLQKSTTTDTVFRSSSMRFIDYNWLYCSTYFACCNVQVSGRYHGGDCLPINFCGQSRLEDPLQRSV